MSGSDWKISGVRFTSLADKVSLTEAVTPQMAIYRTFGNTETRFGPNDTEVYKEKLIGGGDYLVYVEFLPGSIGFIDGFNFTHQDDGITVEVIAEDTLRFSVKTSSQDTKFAVDQLRVVIQKASDPTEKHYITIKVDTNSAHKVQVNL